MDVSLWNIVNLFYANQLTNPPNQHNHGVRNLSSNIKSRVTGKWHREVQLASLEVLSTKPVLNDIRDIALMDQELLRFTWVKSDETVTKPGLRLDEHNVPREWIPPREAPKMRLRNTFSRAKWLMKVHNIEMVEWDRGVDLETGLEVDTSEMLEPLEDRVDAEDVLAEIAQVQAQFLEDEFGAEDEAPREVPTFSNIYNMNLDSYFAEEKEGGADK